MNAIDGMSNSYELLDPRGKDAQPKPSSMPAGRPELGLDMTAVCSPRVGNSNWLSISKSKASARDSGQNSTVVVLEVEAATKPWAGTTYCPYFPRSLCSMALPRDPWSKVSSSERGHDLPQTVAIFIRSVLLQALSSTSQLWLPYPSLFPGVQTTEGSRSRPQTKAEHQGLCEQRREWTLGATGAVH